MKTEFRYRYFVLIGSRFEAIEYKYGDYQILVLLFASDIGFLPLTERALAENLSGETIKKAITH